MGTARKPKGEPRRRLCNRRYGAGNADPQIPRILAGVLHRGMVVRPGRVEMDEEKRVRRQQGLRAFGAGTIAGVLA